MALGFRGFDRRGAGVQWAVFQLDEGHTVTKVARRKPGSGAQLAARLVRKGQVRLGV